MGLKSTITRNVVVDWLGKGLGIVAGLILTPILISHFGKYEYGLWVSIGLSVFWLLHLDLGVSGSVTKYVSENLALEDDQGNIEIFSSALAMLLVNALLALLVVLSILYFIPAIFSVEENYIETSRWVFAIGGFSILFVFPLRVGRGLLQAKLRYDLISLFELMTVISNLALIVLIFGRGYGNLLHLSTLYAGVGMVTEAAIFVTALKMYPGLVFSFSAISKKAIRKLFSVGSSFFLGALSSMAVTRGQTIVTGILLGLGMAPFIAIPNQVLSQLSQFVSSLSVNFLPVSGSLVAQGKVSELRHLNMTSVRYGLGLSLSIGLLLICFGQELYTLWLGHKLNEEDIVTLYWVTLVMVVPFIFGTPQGVSGLMLSGTGKHWFTSKTSIVTAFVSITLSVVLMKYSPLGVYAAAIGWGLRYAINQAILYPVVICRDYKISFSEYFRNVYFAPLMISFPIVLFFIICKMFVDDVSLLNVSLVLLSYGLLCALLVFYVILLPKHRRELCDRFTGFLA